MLEEESFVFFALIGAAIAAGIYAFFHLRANKPRTGLHSGGDDNSEISPHELEQTQHYLEALENTPKNNQMKILSVVEEFTGRANARMIYRESLWRNISFLILALGNALLWIWLLISGRSVSIPGYALPFTLSLVSGLFYWFCSNAFYRSVREGEIRKARYRLRKTKNSPASTLFPSRVTFTKPVQVEPVSQPPVYQYPSTPAPSPASAKPRAGGFSFKHVLLILLLFSAFLAFTDQFLVPGFIREFVNNFGVLGEVFDFKGEGISGCPKSFTDKYIVHPETCSSMSAGVTKPGYKWCDVTARQGGGSDWSLNGTNMRQGSLEQKWVPLICIK